ncbi:MAG: hypothetical protein K6T81_02725 [Alicyclobacillus macrosporangiidus]|uniref:hypothetical protein n=1 Tax=Alicyclobacillus macrosporangiidus TaxID=392015 RepID=UPI0026F1C2D5|nr:hypothetical protein [Alicyclobacillus macrosporangiidus]MCL6597636.1 hypothetical protein [Alicyclobacillus macrosporangiidus]
MDMLDICKGSAPVGALFDSKEALAKGGGPRVGEDEVVKNDFMFIDHRSRSIYNIFNVISGYVQSDKVRNLLYRVQ